ALFPNQSAEAIISRIRMNGGLSVLILAPDTKAGHMMANSALDGLRSYGIGTSGLYYFKEGDMGSMKSVAETASAYATRTAAAKRAKEVLSDILVNGNPTPSERASINAQLERLNKSDTVGSLPFDSVLFLGNAMDSKAIASFLRYFDVPSGQVRFYGTAMWDSAELFSDLTLNGSEYAALPPISPEFSNVYESINNRAPNRMNSMAYDAAMLAISVLNGGAHLTNPNGFMGLDGAIRFNQNGTNERAIQIMRLDASGSPREITRAQNHFISPIYITNPPMTRRPNEIEIDYVINPGDYIRISSERASQYKIRDMRTGRVRQTPIPTPESGPRIMLPEDDSDPFVDPEFAPNQPGPVDRTFIDGVEMVIR
ncbi:MAG: hypothetical protein FWF34_02850, partial [Alphaproteobacteria bacterium]|nr:hypothetical protein [Alphaproteobacteria bacterium]